MPRRKKQKPESTHHTYWVDLSAGQVCLPLEAIKGKPIAYAMMDGQEKVFYIVLHSGHIVMIEHIPTVGVGAYGINIATVKKNSEALRTVRELSEEQGLARMFSGRSLVSIGPDGVFSLDNGLEFSLHSRGVKFNVPDEK